MLIPREIHAHTHAHTCTSAFMLCVHAVSSGHPTEKCTTIRFIIWLSTSMRPVIMNNINNRTWFVFFLLFAILSCRNIERKTNENTQLGAKRREKKQHSRWIWNQRETKKALSNKIGKLDSVAFAFLYVSFIAHSSHYVVWHFFVNNRHH